MNGWNTAKMFIVIRNVIVNSSPVAHQFRFDGCRNKALRIHGITREKRSWQQRTSLFYESPWPLIQAADISFEFLSLMNRARKMPNDVTRLFLLLLSFFFSLFSSDTRGYRDMVLIAPGDSTDRHGNKNAAYMIADWPGFQGFVRHKKDPLSQSVGTIFLQRACQLPIYKSIIFIFHYG